MPIPLFNSIASWLLKKRYHQIELFIKYPGEVQQEVLHQLLEIAEDTEIGRNYDFDTIINYKTFSERLPVMSYEEVEPMIERTRRGNKIFSGQRPSNGLPKAVAPPMPKANLSR